MSSSPRLAVAMEYAAAGIPVFPCHPNTKIPATNRGFHDATTDLATIKNWWAKADYNAAFCPNKAGFAVVDIDPGGEEEWEALCAEHGAPSPTYEVETPRGGRHLYYVGEVAPTQHILGAHIDTRGIGSYVLLPGSTTEDGAYEVRENRAMEPLPGWVPALVRVTREKTLAQVKDMDLAWNVERAAQYLADRVTAGDVATAGEGGDKRTFRLFCTVLDLGVSPARALDLVLEHWNPHCIPPWSPQELHVKCYNAAAYQQNDAGAWGAPDFNAAFAEVLAHMPENVRPKDRFYFENEEEQDTGPDPVWLVPELVPDDSTILLFGMSGGFKSFVTLDIALAVATGLETFGVVPLRTGPVFYCANEGRNSIKKDRRRAWRAARGVTEPIHNFFVGPAPVLTTEGDIQAFGDAIKAKCAGRRPALIIIETAAKMMLGLNENDARDVSVLTVACDTLKEALGCSVLVVHHASDRQGSDSKSTRGSSAFKANFDTLLRVERAERSHAVSVWVTKHKDAEERAKPWTFEARKVENSLALFLTDHATHARLAQVDEGLTNSAIGEVLKTLGAFGVEKGVTTHVLAARLTPQVQGQNDETRLAQVDRTSRVLNAQAATKLRLLCSPSPAGKVWFLPAPTAP